MRAGLVACPGPASRCPEAPLSALVDAGITSLVGVLGTDTVSRSQVTRALLGPGPAAWRAVPYLRVPLQLPRPTLNVAAGVADQGDKVHGLTQQPALQESSSGRHPEAHGSA